MKLLSPLACFALCLSLSACGGMKSKEDISKMSAIEVAQLTCESYKDINLEQLQPLFSEKSYNRLIRKSNKAPEKFREFVKDANCEVIKEEKVIYKTMEATLVSFKKFSSIKVFKSDGQYKVAL